MTDPTTVDDELAACTCPEVWAGNHRTGARNLSPTCPEHGMATEYWRDYHELRAEQANAERSVSP